MTDSVDRLAAARGGDQEALGQALEGCRAYLLRIAEEDLDPALRPKVGASDVVQQTFLEAQRDFARFAGVSEQELLTWLRQVLRNNLANVARDFRQTGKRRLDRESPLRAGSSASPAGQVPADGISPSGHAVAHEQAEAVRRAVDRLPDDYRRVINLRYRDGLSFEEIAAALGRTPNAARKLWARAVEALEGVLTDEV